MMISDKRRWQNWQKVNLCRAYCRKYFFLLQFLSDCLIAFNLKKAKAGKFGAPILEHYFLLKKGYIYIYLGLISLFFLVLSIKIGETVGYHGWTWFNSLLLIWSWTDLSQLFGQASAESCGRTRPSTSPQLATRKPKKSPLLLDNLDE